MLLTNLTYFLSGLLTGFALACFTGVALVRVSTLGKSSPEDPVQITPSPTHRRRVPPGVVVLLIAAGILIATGIQQSLYQHDRDHRDTVDRARTECIAAYNTDVARVRDTVRLPASQRLADAEEVKSDALDAIVLTIIGLRRQPPAVTEADVDRVLADFAAAKATLDAVRAETDTTLEENDYPTLDCP